MLIELDRPVCWHLDRGSLIVEPAGHVLPAGAAADDVAAAFPLPAAVVVGVLIEDDASRLRTGRRRGVTITAKSSCTLKTLAGGRAAGRVAPTATIPTRVAGRKPGVPPDIRHIPDANRVGATLDMEMQVVATIAATRPSRQSNLSSPGRTIADRDLNRLKVGVPTIHSVVMMESYAPSIASPVPVSKCNISNLGCLDWCSPWYYKVDRFSRRPRMQALPGPITNRIASVTR